MDVTIMLDDSVNATIILDGIDAIVMLTKGNEKQFGM